MKATIVLGSDWEGLYIDGVLKAEGHSLAAFHVLQALGIEHETIDANEEWLEEHGNLPEKLRDVQKAT